MATTSAAKRDRRIMIGAEVLEQGDVAFRVWAPRRSKVEVVIEGGRGFEGTPRSVELYREEQGYFSGITGLAGAGTVYRLRLDDAERLYPDPASRFQPNGPHGPSQVVDANAFNWTDQQWQGIKLRGQVIYEMHVGTFTGAGTWQAATGELDELAKLGITVVESMPVADFPGQFGWGYDGVNLYAPTRLYGEPDDFRRFVDRAHSLGIAVILDVVYNHFGPDGNYLSEFAEDYFTDRYKTDWGKAINFDGENAGPVREFIVENAAYWIDEYHLDGLRLDATQDVHDSSEDHILASITRRVREAARGRDTIIIAESEHQNTKLVQSPQYGGYGIDAVWNDDFHHSAMVALTGYKRGYYADYLGRPQELISAIKYGYLYQGQWCERQKKRRGAPALELAPQTFVTFIQNHDQVANSARGERCHLLTSPGRYRAMTAVMLLAPGTPLLFQGQEFAASAPFHFFADHREDLSHLIRNGRAEFLAQFGLVAAPDAPCTTDPCDPQTYVRSKIDIAERDRNAGTYAMHRDLLRLRREDPVFRAQRAGGIDGAVLGDEAFALRFFGDDGDDRLVLVNLGADIRLDPVPEPLLAPPSHSRWELLWSSEDPRYGGRGIGAVEIDQNLRMPAASAVALKAGPDRFVTGE